MNALSPLERIEWISGIAADRALPQAAHPVAGFVAGAYDRRHAQFAYAADTIADALRMARSTVQAGLYALAERGWLTRAGDPSKGRRATAYSLTFPPGTARELGRLDDYSTARPTARELGRLPPQPPGNSGGSRLQPPDQPPEHDAHYQGIRNTGIQVGASAPPLAEKFGAAEGGDEQVGPAFSLKGGGTWRIEASALHKLAAAFPAVDLAGEMAKAAMWCEANAARRKTAAGMLRFLGGWLGRARSPAQASEEPGEISDEARAAIERAEASLPRGADGRALPVWAHGSPPAERAS